MSVPEIWPKELLFHYSRINENLREEFLEKVQNSTSERDDNLRRFLLTMHSIEEQLDNYKEHPEFIFLCNYLLNLKKEVIRFKHLFLCSYENKRCFIWSHPASGEASFFTHCS